MHSPTRRYFLAALAVPLLHAAKRKSLVLADVTGADALPGDSGFDGFIQDVPAAAHAIGIRAALPRYEDSMDDAVVELKRLAGLAAGQGAEALIVTHPGLSGNGAFRGIDLERKARVLDIAGGICAARGLRFLYQNQALEFTGGAAEERGLMARTDAKTVGFLLDTDGMLESGADPAAFFAQNQQRVGGIRISMSDGKFDGNALAAAIRKARWSGWLIAPPGDWKQSREAIRRMFGV